MSDQSAPLAAAPADAPKTSSLPKSAKAEPSTCAKALDFYWTNYLPLMMVFSVLFGYVIPAPGELRLSLSLSLSLSPAGSLGSRAAHFQRPAVDLTAYILFPLIQQESGWTSQRSSCAGTMTAAVATTVSWAP